LWQTPDSGAEVRPPEPKQPMKIKCPKCGRDLEFRNNPYRPFCSERCQMVDLGRWMSEAYQVPLEREENEDEPSLSEEPRES